MLDPRKILDKEFGKTDLPIDTPKARQILDAHGGARIRTWMSICSRCGLCAKSCFVYLSNDRDLRLSPAYKVRYSLNEMHRRKGRFDRAFLEKAYEICWLQCTMCKRCSIYCPFGIDIASMIMAARNVCYSQGVRAGRLAEFTENCRQSGNHMNLPPEELIATCEWVAEEVQEEFSGVGIPIDQPNVKYMYTINPREEVFFPQDITDAAVLLTAVRESWTMPSFGWDCTNLPMLAGDREMGGRQVQNLYEKARDLGSEYILITECGHANRSLVYEGPYRAGYPDGKPPVKIKHFVQLIYEYLRDGRIRIDPQKKLTVPVTYQDPCNISRNGGLWK
jgi:Fe-S oxidoreductase